MQGGWERSEVENATAVIEGLECKGSPCSFLSRIPKYWLEPEERDSIGRAKNGSWELCISWYH